MKTSEQVDLIFAALAEAQGEMEAAAKDSDNPAYRSKYADLAAQWTVWRPVAKKYGLALIQEPVTTEAGVRVTTRLTHKSGQWVEFEPLEIPLEKHNAHGVGSGTSYGKRYGMGGMCGIVAEIDDDGNAAVNGVQTFPAPQAVKPYYRGRPPASVPGGLSKDPAVVQAEEDTIFGKKAEVDPGLLEQIPEAFRTDTYALEMAIARLMQNRGVTATDEKLALSIAFLDKKSVPDATHMDKAKLYIFLNDPAGVADWRKELAKRKGAAK